MDLTLLETWLHQIGQNLPLLLISVSFLGTIFGISYKVISTQHKLIVEFIKQAERRQEEEKQEREAFRADISEQIGKTLMVFQEVSVSLPLIKDFIDKYPKIERVVSVLNQNRHSYYDFVETIISRMKYSFKMNFKNGSHEDKALAVINNSSKHIMRTISKEDDLLHKEYHAAFAEVLREETLLLTKELLKMDDPSIKLKTVEIFFMNMNNLLYFFRINLQGKYLKITPEETKNDLSKHFEGLDKNVLGSTVKELDEASRIFGF